MPQSEQAVFEELVRLHHAATYRAAMRVLGDEEAARDATQEVFLGLLAGGSAAKGRGLPADVRDAGAVLRHRAVQRALARLERDRNRRRREETFAMERPEAFEEDALERTEMRALVGRLMARLPDELRAALALRFGEDLTFAAIAQLTGCSEPTAHERVRRGLERLRGELGRAGCAGLVPGLPGLLTSLEPPPVPAGLEQALLGLSLAAKPALSLSLAATVTALGLGAAALVGVALVPRWIDSAADAPEPLASLREAPALETARAGGDPAIVEAVHASSSGPDGVRHALDAPARPPAAPAGAASSPARVAGRLHDEHGQPLAGVAVTLLGLQPGLKAALPEREARSVEDGSFELLVEPAPYPYALRARAPRRLEHLSLPFELEPGAHHDLGDLRLLPDSGDLPGEYSLLVHVVDGEGLPGADALVVLQRRFQAPQPYEGAAPMEPDEEGVPWVWEREDSERTDAAGRIELTGALLGVKRLRVAPARGPRLAQGQPELAPALVTLEIGRPGRHELVVELAPGRAIVGRLATVDGSPLPPPSPVRNEVVAVGPPAESWYAGELEADGAFRIGGLSGAPHRVHFTLAGLSPLTLEDLRPGAEPLELLLKRADDPRAVGRHDAELHAVVLDARSGAPVAVHPHDVSCEWLWGEELGLTPAELVSRRGGQPRQQQQLDLSGEEPRRSPEIHAVGLRPGTYALWVGAPGYSRALAGIYELARGELVAGIQVRLEPLERGLR